MKPEDNRPASLAAAAGSGQCVKQCRHAERNIAHYKGYDWCHECGAIRRVIAGYAPFDWKRPKRVKHD